MKKILLTVCIALTVCLLLAGICLRHEDAAVKETAAGQELSRRIVVDAGHGEPDGGAVGKAQGTREAGLNLQIAKILRTLLEEADYEVIMTREGESQLMGSKNADMAERRRIIEESGQALTISIHQNFYEGDSSVSGPQVFYAPGSAEGERLAAAIQQELNGRICPDRPRTEHEGNYYIVKSGEAPAVIVECGFLSNPQDEALLLKSQHQLKLARAIFAGMEQYLTTSAEAE